MEIYGVTSQCSALVGVIAKEGFKEAYKGR